MVHLELWQLILMQIRPWNGTGSYKLVEQEKPSLYGDIFFDRTKKQTGL